MAVQAQYPSSNKVAFSPDYSRKAPRLGACGLVLDEAAAAAQAADIFGGAATQPVVPQRQVLFGTAMFSGEAESDLTCNLSGSRKRARDDTVVSAFQQIRLLQQQQQQQQQQLWLANAVGKVGQANLSAPSVAGAGLSTGMHVSLENKRLNDSSLSSTSGRPPAVAPTPAICSPANNPLVQDLVSQMYSQNHEIDTLIRFQNERLRARLEEARKRHCGALLSSLEEAVLRRLREKEAEMESVNRRNAELEEKLRQIAAENQIWFNVARNNEAIVSSLRASLEHALQNNSARAGHLVPSVALDVEEGYGDSDCVAPVVPADDAQSCCDGNLGEEEKTKKNQGEPRPLRLCKVCLEQEVSVLLLPCRHLCLCKQCEARLESCPVCHAVKNASLQIFLS